MFFDNVRVRIFDADFNLLGCEFITSHLVAVSLMLPYNLVSFLTYWSKVF